MRLSIRGLVVTAAVLMGPIAEAAADRSDWQWLVVCSGPEADAERNAVVRALKLLPRLPARVVVLDVTGAKPDVRETLLRLDAFVTNGSPVVYVVRQSALLQGAIAGSVLHVHALSTVLWHEMAHVEGADEREARKREESLWTSFVRDQRVDALVALRYLDALTRRPDHGQLVLR